MQDNNLTAHEKLKQKFSAKYRDLPRPECPLDLMLAYYEGTLEQSEMQKVEKHLSTCGLCKAETLMAKHQLIAEARNWQPSEDFYQKLFKRIMVGSPEVIANKEMIVVKTEELERVHHLFRANQFKELVRFLTQDFIVQRFPHKVKEFKEEFEENYLRADQFAKNRIPPLQEEIPLESAAFADSSQVKSLYYEIVVVAYRLVQAVRVSRDELTKEMKHLVKSHYPKEMVNFMVARLEEL